MDALERPKNASADTTALSHSRARSASGRWTNARKACWNMRSPLAIRHKTLRLPCIATVALSKDGERDGGFQEIWTENPVVAVHARPTHEQTEEHCEKRPNILTSLFRMFTGRCAPSWTCRSPRRLFVADSSMLDSLPEDQQRSPCCRIGTERLAWNGLELTLTGQLRTGGM